MTTNIIEAIQKKLGYPSLEKIDPNIQETKNKTLKTTEEKLAQSAIPVVLAGFYKYATTDDGVNILLNTSRDVKWLDKIFGDQKQKAVENVAHYAGVSSDEAGADMEQISREASQIIREAGGDKHSVDKVKTFMSNHRHNILVYLPDALQAGYLLDDNSMDDRTNKMEGPISNFMHGIEDKLAGGKS